MSSRNLRNSTARWRGKHRPSTSPPQPAWAESGHGHYFAATFEALAGGEPPPVGGATALHNLRIIAGARRATAERRAIDLQESTTDATTTR